MRTGVRFFLVLVLLVSPAMKMYDFPGTGMYFADLFGVEPRAGQSLLALLILLELLFAGWIALHPSRRAFSLLIVLFTAFLCASVWIALSGRENCGCFGTRLTSSPSLAILKNLVLIACAGFLRRAAPSGGAVQRPEGPVVASLGGPTDERAPGDTTFD